MRLFDVENANKFYLIAQKFYKDKKYHEALANLNTAHKLNPNKIEVYELRSLIHLNETKNYSAALDNIQIWIMLVPHDAEAYDRLAYYYECIGEFGIALRYLNACIRMDPKVSTFYWNRAEVHDKQNVFYHEKADLCERMHDEALEFGKVDNQYSKKHALFRKKGDFYKNKAIADFYKVIELGINASTPYHRLGSMLAEEGRYDEAIRVWSEGITISPTSVSLHIARAKTYFKLGEYLPAIKDYSAVIEMSKGTENEFYGRALALRALQSPTAKAHALVDYVAALEMVLKKVRNHSYFDILYSFKTFLDGYTSQAIWELIPLITPKNKLILFLETFIHLSGYVDLKEKLFKKYEVLLLKMGKRMMRLHQENSNNLILESEALQSSSNLSGQSESELAPLPKVLENPSYHFRSKY